MKQVQRKISLLLVIVMLASLFGVAGCGKKQPETSEPVSAPSAGVSGADLPEDDSPDPEDLVEAWDGEVRMPFINPMGWQNKYDEVGFEIDGTHHFRWVDENNRLDELSLHGALWKLKVSGVDDLKVIQRRMLRHARAKGLHQLIQVDEREMLLQGTAPDGSHWWGHVRMEYDAADMTIVEERRLEAGRPMEIQTRDYPNGNLTFTTMQEGLAFQSMRVEMDKGSVQISGYSREGFDAYSRSTSTGYTLYGYESLVYYDNAMSQDPGSHTWQIS